MAMLKLNDGNRIPALGLGIWQIPADQTGHIVSSAIDMGYGLIDGAAIYGNEAGMGEGVRAASVPRDQVFITTKIWNDRQGHDETLRAFDESVARIGFDPDLLLIHWPCPAKGLYLDTWRAMIRLRDEGRVKSIGVSNFMADHLERVIGETGVTPVLNQIELHPDFQQADLRALHDRLGIVTQCWTPLGKGRAFDTPEVQAVAKRTGKTPAQVILRWHVQLGCSVIPRSTNVSRLAQNRDLFDFALTDEDMAAMATLDKGARGGPDPMLFS
ncbi:MAG: aldo/keto reductase [Paracoccaceae bacterium]